MRGSRLAQVTGSGDSSTLTGPRVPDLDATSRGSRSTCRNRPRSATWCPSIKRPRLSVFQPSAYDAARRILRIAIHGVDPGPYKPALSGDEAGVEPQDGHEIPEGAKT